MIADRVRMRRFGLVGNIDFAHSATKNLLLPYADTNGDGEISYKEASEVTSLPDFRDRLDLIYLDELQYFTGLTELPYAFLQDCKSIKSITLPPNITYIYSWAFRRTKITSMIFPKGILVMEGGLLYECPNLSYVELPPNITAVGDNIFYGTTALKTVVIPSLVETLGSSCFRYSAITHIRLPNSVNNIEALAFGSCTSLRALILESTSPPKLSSTAISGLPNIKIYVPENSLSAYKNASFWNNYSSKIFPLSEIPNIYK